MASFTRQKGKDAFQHIMTKVFGVDDRAPLMLSLAGEHGFDNVLDIVQLTKDDVSNLTYTVTSADGADITKHVPTKHKRMIRNFQLWHDAKAADNAGPVSMEQYMALTDETFDEFIATSAADSATTKPATAAALTTLGNGATSTATTTSATDRVAAWRRQHKTEPYVAQKWSGAVVNWKSAKRAYIAIFANAGVLPLLADGYTPPNMGSEECDLYEAQNIYIFTILQTSTGNGAKGGGQAAIIIQRNEKELDGVKSWHGIIKHYERDAVITATESDLITKLTSTKLVNDDAKSFGKHVIQFQKTMLDLTDISPGLTDSFKIGLLDATIEGSEKWKEVKNNLHSIAKATEKQLEFDSYISDLAARATGTANTIGKDYDRHVNAATQDNGEDSSDSEDDAEAAWRTDCSLSVPNKYWHGLDKKEKQKRIEAQQLKKQKNRKKKHSSTADDKNADASDDDSDDPPLTKSQATALIKELQHLRTVNVATGAPADAAAGAHAQINHGNGTTLSMVPTAQINFSGRIPGTRDNTGPVYRPLKSGSTVTDERGYKHTIV